MKTKINNRILTCEIRTRNPLFNVQVHYTVDFISFTRPAIFAREVLKEGTIFHVSERGNDGGK